jgi:DNA-binding SARP family transcriptional activator
MLVHARLSLLNGFSLDVDGSRPRRTTLGELPPSVQRLLAHLGLYDAQARTAIAGTLWPEVADEQAHASLRTTLWRLQKVVPGLVDSSHSTVRLNAGVAVDVRELDEWVRMVLSPGSEVERAAIPRAALRGELLPGWYEDWVLVERERVRQMRVHALERLSERLMEASHFAEAVQAATAAVVAEPLRESAHRALIRVHFHEGNVIEGLRQYETYRALVHDELALAPTSLMDELVRPYLPVSKGSSRHVVSGHVENSQPSRRR